MKKLLFTLHFLLLLFIASPSYAQTWGCIENLSVSLSGDGNATLIPNMLTLATPPADLQLSKDDVNYYDELTYTCDELGSSIIYSKELSTGETCSTNLNIEDKLNPIPYCINLSTVLLSNGQVELWAIDFNNASFDNCSTEDNLRYTFGLHPDNDPTYDDGNKSSSRTFSSADVALSPISVEMHVWDESGNSDFCLVSLTVLESMPALACFGQSNVSLGPDGAIVTPDMILAGSYPLGNLKLSLDGINFYSELTFDCSDVDVSYQVTVMDAINQNTCWGQLTISDKFSPAIVGSDFTYDMSDESEVYTVLVDDIVSAAYDNCDSPTITFSPSTFDVYDLGHNTITITATDQAGNVASATVDFLLTLNGDPFATICHPEKELSTSYWTCEINSITASDVYVGNAAHDSSRVSLDNITFVDVLEDIESELGVPFAVYVETIDDGVVTYCESSVTIVDNVPPVAICRQNYEILLQPNGSNPSTALLYAIVIDNGSYDFCSEVSLKIDRYPSAGIWDAYDYITFTQADLGEQHVVLYVEDENGNWNSVHSIITVIGNGTCAIADVTFPGNLNITGAVVQELTPDNLVEFYNFTVEQSQPTWEDDCDGLVSTYTDNVLNITNNDGDVIGYKILREWLVLDWFTGETKSAYQIIKAFYGPFTLSCLSSSVGYYSSTFQLNAQDMLQYNFSNTDLSMVIYDESSNVVVNNLLLQEHHGQTLTYTVTDNNSGQQCTNTINVIGSEGCSFDESNIDWPNEVINILAPGVDPGSLTPDVLISDYGFTETEVKVELNLPSCSLGGISTNDIVYNLPNGFFKIVREFIVIDWDNYVTGSTSSIWTFTQTINYNVSASDLICDVQSRGAPVGTCMDGHTLEDQVEWPNDIEISDYRITPDDLVSYSGVDVLDARPSFYHSENTAQYEAEYFDVFVEIGPTKITLARSWHVTHLEFGHTWNYAQVVVVDFSQFENLVTVNTTTGRAVPNVIINDVNSTDENGILELSDASIQSLFLEDEGINGLNILDLILTNVHILKLENLDEVFLGAADFNNDSKVNAVDIIYLREVILGRSEIEDNNWVFEDKILSTDPFKPKGKFLAYKRGDIDDSALLGDDVIADPENSFEFEDILLNNGQSYEVPVYLKNGTSSRGFEIKMKIDQSKVKVDGISSEHFYLSEELWHVTESGILTILVFEYGSNSKELGGYGSSEIFNIHITALDNSVLGESLSTDDLVSYSASEDYELVILNGNLNNSINGVSDEELSGLSVYPNPASDYITVDMSDVSVKGAMSVTIFHTNGEKIFTVRDQQLIDIKSLSSGLYFYQVNIDGYSYTDKLSIVK